MRTNTIRKIREKTDAGLYENIPEKKFQNIRNIPKKSNKNIKHKTQNFQS